MWGGVGVDPNDRLTKDDASQVLRRAARLARRTGAPHLLRSGLLRWRHRPPLLALCSFDLVSIPAFERLTDRRSVLP